MRGDVSPEQDLFEQFKTSVLNVDPVSFIENNLTIDGEKFDVSGGYKPFADIYRYICLKAVDDDSLPVILVKGRQVGATTMAAALEAYFVGCGLYGNGKRSPMRIMHLFPTLSLAAAYTKDKLSPIIQQSRPTGVLKSNGLPMSFMETKMDRSSPANDNQHFKKFVGGNQIWIESTGLTGDRIRGRQLCLETELPTPDRGFIKLKDLKQGDKLFDENGNICNVTKLHPIQESPESYRVIFNDGTQVDACAEHLWGLFVDSKYKVLNTKDILKAFNKEYKTHSFKITKELSICNYDLPEEGVERYISKIYEIPSKPMRCITVDSPSHLYLVTRSFIPTHNTVDCLFFDECFPYNQLINTSVGKVKIGKIYNDFKSGNDLPLVLTYNESSKDFEYKKITNAWNRGKRDLVLVKLNNRKVKCTPNHPFLTTKGWVKAQDLSCGDLVLTSPTEAIQVSQNLNDDQYQVVLGSFLGDGHLSNHGASRYRLVEQHGIKQADYCTWKANMFNQDVSVIEKNGYAQKPTIKFSSKIFGLNKELPETKTSCPQWVLDDLDARGLAVWFMDDGTRTGVLSTCSFDEDSQKRIVKKLQSMGINCKYSSYKVKNRKQDSYYSIYIGKEGRDALFKIIKPYFHKSMSYKLDNEEDVGSYDWNNSFNKPGLIPVKSVENINEQKVVYDIEVQDNHNFIVASVKSAKDDSGIIVHNCQDMSAQAIGAADKIAAQARYGEVGQGIKVLFGTPKQKGGAYWNMWQKSSQQYFHLHCEKCEKLFPLYRPDINWEDVWLYGFVVRCTHCGHEQDKRKAAAKGKWIPINKDPEGTPDDQKTVKMHGFHINQLYIPRFSKEKIIAQKPGISPTNTERIYMNEVLGEFYDGEGGTITKEEIIDKCLEDRAFAAQITPSDQIKVYAGFDWGQKANLDMMAGRRQGQSYSCAVILTAHGPELFSVDFAMKLSRNDPQEKKDVVEEMFRRYSVGLSVGDVGDAGDLTHTLQSIYGDAFLGSRAANQVNSHIKYRDDVFPREIVFDRDYYISELFDLLRRGCIKFPKKSWDQVEWLINHCCSMEVKVTTARNGEPRRTFVKGTTPNDGFMALLNAYLAWKFDVTQRFNIKDPNNRQHEIAQNKASGLSPILGYMPKW